MPENAPRMVVGVGWYRAEDYGAILELREDSEKLSNTYQSWLVAAEKGLAHLKSQGQEAYPVEVRPDELREWCKAQGTAPNAKSQIALVNRKLRDLVASETEPQH